MASLKDIENMAVKDAIGRYPEVGAILDRHKIGCTKCKVGICKVKDVVRIHHLPKQQEKRIYDEIDRELEGMR